MCAGTDFVLPPLGSGQNVRCVLFYVMLCISISSTPLLLSSVPHSHIRLIKSISTHTLPFSLFLSLFLSLPSCNNSHILSTPSPNTPRSYQLAAHLLLLTCSYSFTHPPNTQKQTSTPTWAKSTRPRPASPPSTIHHLHLPPPQLPQSHPSTTCEI